jgi:hypothetical protein
MEEMFNQDMTIWISPILNVKNATIMVTKLEIVEA